jgi:hypothetical protein
MCGLGSSKACPSALSGHVDKGHFKEQLKLVLWQDATVYARFVTL